MTAKIISARSFITGRVAVDVWLDITKLLPDGVTPDPDWMYHREWMLNVADWTSRTSAQKSAWIAAAKAELVAACSAQIAILNDAAAGGTALPMEGQTF